MTSEWGRPTEGIFQTAFVVEDLDFAIEQFSSRFQVGPWRTFHDVDPEGAGCTGATRRGPDCTSRSDSPGR